jgi:aspartyl protease family protein
MAAGTGGHFISQGQINGRAVQLVVDTGATSVSIGSDDAQRIGLNYKAGQEVRLSTANGTAQGWRIKLNSMRVGDVDVYDVDAVVTTGSMPYVLLGNSFLTRFQMTRNNDQLVLVKRF